MFLLPRLSLLDASPITRDEWTGLRMRFARQHVRARQHVCARRQLYASLSLPPFVRVSLFLSFSPSLLYTDAQTRDRIPLSPLTPCCRSLCALAWGCVRQRRGACFPTSLECCPRR